MNDRVDVRARDCGRGIDVRDESHNGYWDIGRYIRRNLAIYHAELTHANVRHAELPQLGDEKIRQRPLLCGARRGRLMVLRLRVDADVTKKWVDGAFDRWRE